MNSSHRVFLKDANENDMVCGSWWSRLAIMTEERI